MRIGLLFFFTFLFITSYSQNSFVVLRGKIIDATTGEVVSYATISLRENGIKTMSNEDGNFIFKVPAENKGDSIYISHVGYKQLAIVIHSYEERQGLIKLQQNAVSLAEIKVKTINPVELIKKAIEKIPENYSTTPYVLSGFYRLTGKKEKRIIDLSEAVFDIYNQDYTINNKQFRVVKARLDKDLTAFGGMEGIDMGASPKSIIEDDYVGIAAKGGLLSDEEINDHVFAYKGIVDYNGQDAYKIDYREKEGVKKSLYDGSIYIDVNSLAFVQFTQRRNREGLKYWEFDFKQRVMLKLSGIQVDRLADSGYVTYSKYGDKYYLSQSHGVGAWHIVGGRRQFELNPMTLKFNLLITKIDTTNVNAFEKSEAMRGTRLMETEAPDVNTDSTDAFWGNYNLVQAEFNVDSASKVIRANNQTLKYKEALEVSLRKYKAGKEAKIDSILSFYYNKHQFNGVALVKYDGKVIYEKGFGMANMEKNIPNTGQTQFRIGSTSKQFTAMIIMQLVNENKLSVDDTAGRFIPGFKNGRVTIQQLLTHQSGIPNYLGIEEYTSQILTHKYSTDGLVKNFCSDPLEFEPGTKMEYSNSGFVVLADIIEKVTGRKYADELQERIFAPLGMTHSYFGKEGRDTSKLAVGYMYEQPEMTYPVQNETGAGGITSNAEDLLLWNNALSSNTLLPKDKMDELFKPRVKWDEWGADYGYGWMIDRLQFSASKKHTVQYHPGTEVGFFDMLVRQPDKDIFIILLSNKSDFPRFDMTDLILNELN